MTGPEGGIAACWAGTGATAAGWAVGCDGTKVGDAPGFVLGAPLGGAMVGPPAVCGLGMETRQPDLFMHSLKRRPALASAPLPSCAAVVALAASERQSSCCALYFDWIALLETQPASAMVATTISIALVFMAANIASDSDFVHSLLFALLLGLVAALFPVGQHQFVFLDFTEALADLIIQFHQLHL